MDTAPTTSAGKTDMNRIATALCAHLGVLASLFALHAPLANATPSGNTSPPQVTVRRDGSGVVGAVLRGEASACSAACMLHSRMAEDETSPKGAKQGTKLRLCLS